LPWLRGLRLIAHLAWGLVLVARLTFGDLRQVAPERLAQRWSARLLKILGIRVRVEGQPLAGSHLTAANHISWLDIPVLSALEPTRFISKSEVRHWPIAGSLAVAAGTFFLRRGKGGTPPLLEKLTPYLRAGGSVVLFPEGTTTAGAEVRPFHPRLFSAAIEAQRPVQPVTLQYTRSSRGEAVAPFIGDDSLGAHLLRLLCAEGLAVSVLYGPPIAPEGGRDALAGEAETHVRSALAPFFANPAATVRPEWSRAIA
jgi:1-acyl-sn-glycerol-3-phosphate acyltransferase